MHDKKIVIIGATGGIGSVLSKSLKYKGARLFLIARNATSLESLADELDSDHVSGNIAETRFAKNTFDKAFETLGKIDGIVNLAGSMHLKPAHLTTDEEWQHTFNQNVTSSFNAIRFGYPHTEKQCSIVLMSSVAGVIGLQNHEAISASKAAVIGLTKSAAASYAPKGLRVNCIAPGLVETPLSQRITSNPNARKASTSLHPLGRIGQPDDIVPVIEFLLGDSSSWVTGQVFGIDGGLSTIK
jgi:3-oxoacyl-[acyl-carrier protein] reductase